jgi:uncharacterized protein
MQNPNIEVILMPTMACNMACDYCYVVEKYPGIMDLDLAKSVIGQVVAHNNPSVATKVYWHGAEPLLAGINFYREICAWTRERYGIDAVQHHIQTNGTLLNEEWFDLFIQEHITVGVSLDGPKEIHDTHRKTLGGRGTFETVFKNIMAAREKKLYFDALCVITRECLGHEDEIFDFFYEYKIDFGFEPLVPETEQMARELAITPAEYAQVAIKLFDRWFFQKERRLRMVIPPYHYLKAILGGGNSYCNFSRNCTRHYLAVSPNGTVHSCIMFAGRPEYAFGNIANSDLEAILKSPMRQQMLVVRSAQITECRNCRWLSLCHGGCPHHALVQHGTLLRPDMFCESYRLIFEHVYKVAIESLQPAQCLLHHGKLPAN